MRAWLSSELVVFDDGLPGLAITFPTRPLSVAGRFQRPSIPVFDLAARMLPVPVGLARCASWVGCVADFG